MKHHNTSLEALSKPSGLVGDDVTEFENICSPFENSSYNMILSFDGNYYYCYLIYDRFNNLDDYLVYRMGKKGETKFILCDKDVTDDIIMYCIDYVKTNFFEVKK